MSNYLRNRPFMLITYSRIPLTGVATQAKGWQTNEDAWDVNENMVIADRVNSNDLQRSDVIIDLINNSVVKNRFGDAKDVTVVNGYVERYYGEVKAALSRWVSEHSGNLEKIQQIAKDHGIELPSAKTQTSDETQ